MSALSEMIYQRLDESHDQIRVVSILSEETGTAKLSCLMETVSLVDYKSEYGDLTRDLAPMINKRDHLQHWWKYTDTLSKPILDQAIPPQICPDTSYRFNWGDFATLSYTWGDARDVEAILLNGNETYITKNLATALRTLRRLGCFTGAFKLWVDSICINQQDGTERGLQVAKMRQLFSGSWTTMAFLGPSDENSALAIDLLRTLAKYEVSHSTAELRDILQENPGYLGDGGKWLALQTLLQRRYWSRLWIVQEVALAPQNMLMFVGDESITWQEVQDALTAIHTCLWYVKDLCLQHDRQSLRAFKCTNGDISGLWDVENLHHIDKGLARITRKQIRNEGWLTFAELLEVANSTSCSVNLDKVYGLLAIMEPAISENITVDYGRESSALFSLVARSFANHTKNVEFLRDGNTGTTPSWAPDWTSKDRNRDQLNPFIQYSADGGKQAVFDFSLDGRCLIVRGITLDTVEELATSSDIKAGHQPKKFQSAYGDLSATRVALYRTLVGNRAGHLGDRVCSPPGWSIFRILRI